MSPFFLAVSRFALLCSLATVEGAVIEARRPDIAAPTSSSATAVVPSLAPLILPPISFVSVAPAPVLQVLSLVVPSTIPTLALVGLPAPASPTLATIPDTSGSHLVGLPIVAPIVSEIPTTSALSFTSTPLFANTSIPSTVPSTTTTAANNGATNFVLVGVGIVGDTSAASTTTKASLPGLALPGMPAPAGTTSSTSIASSGPSSTATSSWLNMTSTTSTQNCVTLTDGEIWTTYSMVPNTTTIWKTVYNNNITTTFPTTAEFTAPTLCPSTYVSATTTPDSIDSAARTVYSPAAVKLLTVVTAIITSKNGITALTTVAPPTYSTIPLNVGGSGDASGGLVLMVPPTSTTPKKTVVIPAATTAPVALAASAGTFEGSPAVTPAITVAASPAATVAQSPASTLAASEPITSVAKNGVTVVVSPTNAIIGGQTVTIGSTNVAVTVNNAVYTVGPTQVIGPSLSIDVPPTSILVHSGSEATTPPTNVIILDGEPFSVIGSSVVVLGGSSITYGAGIAAQTSFINGEDITIGPAGVSYDGTTLGGTAHPTGTQIGLAGGLSITQIGSTLAVVDDVTLTVGPSAAASTTVIAGHTITAGPVGLGLGGNTLQYPFNPTSNAVTVGSITFTEIGSSLAVIHGTTYTFGVSAKPTTTVVNGQTISFGPGGIGFASTTFVSFSSTPTGTAAPTKKNAAGTVNPAASVMLCVFGSVVLALII